ncbi:hypothetical protein ACKQTC_04585 [Peptococcus simiae]|uniref:HotDog ACOT-type domain-containing protein n=1 Tax=Peptococcus simiae TaxID=1643805 RepID=A0ABW9H0M9_9FIRM
MRQTELTFEIMLRPEWLNGSGTYHGGEMLKLMDELCGSLATVYDPRTYVTGFIHGVSLVGSPTVRNIIRGHAAICYTTPRTVTMEVTLYYRKRSETRDKERVCAHGYYIFVDTDGTEPIAPFEPVDREKVERLKKEVAVYLEESRKEREA